MKKLFILLSLCLALFMTACQKKDNALESLEDTNASDTNVENDSLGTGADKEDDVSDTSNLYYGTWKVTSSICVAPVSAISLEESELYHGTVLKYEEDRFVWKGEIYDAPVYQADTETSDEFAESYNNLLTFSDLGLTGSEATVVAVDCETFGNYFYVKDENTLIISFNGVFFEASRDLADDSEKAQIYEGIYFDNRLFGDSDREDYPSIVYQIIISNVTDSSFDFSIYEITIETEERELFIPEYTAVFSSDGTEATYSGDDYNLTFVFPDYHGSYPVVTDIEILGFAPFEGFIYVNGSIPGHEFG